MSADDLLEQLDEELHAAEQQAAVIYARAGALRQLLTLALATAGRLELTALSAERLLEEARSEPERAELLSLMNTITTTTTETP